MNSHQRRTDRRFWQNHVRLTRDQVDQNGYDSIFDWCCNTFGNGTKNNYWREKHRHTGTWWQFSDEKKAVLFALRWQ